LVAAITNAKQIFPDKKVVVGFPFRRKNNHFEKIADYTFDIKAKRYQRYQLNNPLILPNGKVLYKPEKW
jgi:predicted NBD/HSP70 family sugar kinase